MATITRTIGTSSRDYSTITLWEADLDNGSVYSSGDDAIGECYADGDFSESPTVNGGGTIGLASITLRSASGEGHDGTANTGVRIIGAVELAVTVTFEDLEIDANGANQNHCLLISGSNSSTVRRNLLHGIVADVATNIAGILRPSATGTPDISNNIIYDIEQSRGAAVWTGSGFYENGGGIRSFNFENNTVVDIRRSSAGTAGYGVSLATDASGKMFNNNIVMSTTGNNFQNASNGDHNMSQDTTAFDANAVTSAVLADQFVSTTPGAEDYKLKTGSDAIGAGSDLGTANGGQVDIVGRDRDAEGDTWDIGANQFVSVGGGTTINATTGSVVIAGVASQVSAGTTIQAATGDIVASGVAATVSSGTTVQAATGGITVSGVAALVSSGTTIQATTGSVTVAGVSGVVNNGANINATTGEVLVAGVAASVSAGTDIAATTGAVSVSGVAASVVQSTTVSASTGGVVVAGQAATIASAIQATTGTVVIVGIQASLLEFVEPTCTITGDVSIPANEIAENVIMDANSIGSDVSMGCS